MSQISLLQAIHKNIGRRVIGKETVIDQLLNALVCRGHVLIEDVPGVGKTTLVQAFARSFQLSFQRIQFTPDVLPSDITGFAVYSMQQEQFRFQSGLIMHQIILADEINRSSPKTQSSLLEVMEENQVTVDGITYPVPQPFMVLATQNPVEYTGTFPLPEAQLDRFLLKVSMGYPTHAEEIDILLKHQKQQNINLVESVADTGDVDRLRADVENVTIAQPVLTYITRIAEATRQHEAISLGLSPRGSIALMRSARARALIQDRAYVLPDDIQAQAEAVIIHRLQLRPEAALHRDSATHVLRDILRGIPVPAVRS